MAMNHWKTKRRRRPKSGKRQDTKRGSATMAKLKQLAIAQENPFKSEERLPDAEAIREKLRHLGDLLESCPEPAIFNALGRYLALRMSHDKIVPAGFLLAFQLVMYDLEAGVSGFPNMPLPGELLGYPAMLYSIWATQLPEIADAVLPANYAADVKACLEEVSANAVA